VRFMVAHLGCLLTITECLASNIVIALDYEFILGHRRKSVEHQLGDVTVRDPIVFVLPLAPAGYETRVPKPSKPFRYCRNPLTHRFGDIAHAGFLPAQDSHQPQPALIPDRSKHANGALETPIEAWLRQRVVDCGGHHRRQSFVRGCEPVESASFQRSMKRMDEEANSVKQWRTRQAEVRSVLTWDTPAARTQSLPCCKIRPQAAGAGGVTRQVKYQCEFRK
jgi:hypothetical protein